MEQASSSEPLQTVDFKLLKYKIPIYTSFMVNKGVSSPLDSFTNKKRTT